MKIDVKIISENNLEENKGKYSFIANDVLGVMDNLSIDKSLVHIYAHYDGSTELREKLIKEIISNFSNNPIIAQACISRTEFPSDKYYIKELLSKDEEIGDREEITPEMIDSVIEREFEFLKSLGFESINDFVNYEWSVACIYTGNEVGKQIYNKIQDYVKLGKALAKEYVEKFNKEYFENNKNKEEETK